MIKPPPNRKMDAIIFHGPGDLRLKEVAIPSLKPGEILVKIDRALTCGTDFKAFRQGHPVLLNHQLPSPFGHELCGFISEVSEGIDDFRVGQRVVAANSAPCDSCFYCKKGLTNLCETRWLLNGAYAQYIVIPPAIVKHNLHPIPESLDSSAAALAEPLACVVRALEQMDFNPGDCLAILGCGLMGSLMVQVAKAYGLHVTAIGRDHEKLKRAKNLGADATLSIVDLENPTEEILKLSPQNRGFDFVVEAVGKTEVWDQAVRLARRGGSVCFYGGCAFGSSFQVDTHRIHYDEIKIFGSFHHTPKHFAQALGLLTQGKINSRHFIRGEISLNDLPQHFKDRQDQPFQKSAVRP